MPPVEMEEVVEVFLDEEPAEMPESVDSFLVKCLPRRIMWCCNILTGQDRGDMGERCEGTRCQLFVRQLRLPASCQPGRAGLAP